MENATSNLPPEIALTNNKEALNETVSIPVIHEELIIGKKVIETGKVRISKKINEENQFINIPLIHEELDIQRVAVNQFVDNIPEAVRYEGDTMIIPVLKEVSVVRVMLVEEIRVTKKRVQTQDAQNVLLRKEEINIENIPANQQEIKE